METLIPQHLDEILLTLRAHLAAGENEAALRLLEAALPHHDQPVLWRLAATLRQQAGDHPGAEAAWRAVLRHTPEDAAAHRALAHCLLHQGQAEAAREALQTALRQAPQDPDLHAELGRLHAAAGQREAARAAYRQALRLEPGHAMAGNNLALLDLDEHPERACQTLQALLRHHPHDPELWINLAAAHLAGDEPQEAERAARRALELAPEHPEAGNNLARALLDQDRPEAALALLQDLVRRHPRHLGLALNLALALERLDRLEEALAQRRQSVREHPHDPRPALSLARLLERLGRLDEADAVLATARQRHPHHRDLRYQQALLDLVRGRLHSGWDHYRARPTLAEAHAPPPLPGPLPADLHGQELLIVGEQGLGTELFFLRFLPELRRRGAHVTYRAGEKLIPLLHRLGLMERVIGPHTPAPPHHLALAVGDLPLACAAHDPACLPPPLPLRPETAQRRAMAEHLARLGPPPYIGLTWRAGAGRPGTLKKAVDLSDLHALLAPLPGTLVSLQRAPHPGERERLEAALGRPVHDFAWVNDDLEAALALLDHLDDYLTVSNTNLHLRAGLGRPSRVLVPHPPDWRWGLQGPSPWFPDHPVYRQGRDGDWGPALERLAHDLEAAHGTHP